MALSFKNFTPTYKKINFYSSYSGDISKDIHYILVRFEYIKYFTKQRCSGIKQDMYVPPNCMSKEAFVQCFFICVFVPSLGAS